MKKLKLNSIDTTHILTREQLKQVIGGSGGSGSNGPCIPVGGTGCGWGPSSSHPGHPGPNCCSGVCYPNSAGTGTRCLY